MPYARNEEDLALVPRLRAAAEHYAGRDNNKRVACLDIANKIERYGSCVSERQRSYAQALCRWTNTNELQRHHALGGQTETVGERLARVAREAGRSTVALLSLAEEARVAGEAMEHLTMSGVSLQRIAQLFAAAALHGLRHPKIRLRRGSWKIIITPAPNHGRHPGCFYIKANGQYQGRIIPAGDFLPARGCSSEVVEALREFAADPLRAAAAYGHAVGSCCFCGRELTDGRSVAMGYGPVCAEHYGLEWGEQRAAQNVTIDPAVASGGRPSTQRITAEDMQRMRDRLVQAPVRNPPLPLPYTALVASGRRLGRSSGALADRVFGRSPVSARRDSTFAEPSRPTPQEPTAVPLTEEDEDKHFM